MSTIKKSYNIYFGIDNIIGGEQNQPKNEIPEKNIKIVENFNFYDYNSEATIGYLKEFFLTTFGQRHKYCKCVLFVYFKYKPYFGDGRFIILNKEDNKKLSDFEYNELYLIKTKAVCDCEYKMYTKYMNKQKFDIIAELKNVNEINEKNVEKIKELEEMVKEYNKLQQENKFSTNNAKPEEFYDIVININSIRNVNNEGWDVKFIQKGKDKYNKHKDQELIILGVLGNNNKGKSFLLSKISKIDLPVGTSIQTEGLSVKYPELKGYKGRYIILLDSAGLETPVLKKNNIKNEKKEEQENNEDKEEDKNKKEINEIDAKEMEQNKEFKENARDKIMTELFLEDFIIDACDILLIVVGKLTYSEQLLINKIKVESKKQNKGRIFIIHNLQEFRTIKQVENYIENSLLKCSTFDLKKRTRITTKKDPEEKKEENINNNEINNIPAPINNINNIEEVNNEIEEENIDENKKGFKDVHFTEILHYGDKKKLDIYHLIIANEDSEAGKEYNQYAYDFIENIYNLISDKKKFDVFEKVKDNFEKLSKTILNDKIDKNLFNSTEDILNTNKIKLNKKEELSLKKCYTDELGFSFFKTRDFEPKYNYFKPDDNTLEIRLEIPGNGKCSVSHKVEGDQTIITVTGNKENDKTPKDPKDNILNIREFGQFELNIPLKVEEYKINAPKPKKDPVFTSGVCCIQYELAQKGDVVEAKPDTEL